MKRFLKGKRTAIFGAAIASLGVIQTADLAFLPDSWSGPIIILAGIGTIWLRALTDTPLGKRY